MSKKVFGIGIKVGAILPDPQAQFKRWMEGWSTSTSRAISSKCAINPESGSWFLFPTMPAGRMSIVFVRFGLAITSESRGDSSIANDSSWTVFFGTVVSRLLLALLKRMTEKR